MTESQISLTGIKPTGRPHLGNYLGAMQPALEIAQDVTSVYFVANLHALTTVHDGTQLAHDTYDVAACWLACGLDPEKVTFFRQSDVPEISELYWILACFTGQGLLERAHAYKSAKADGRAINAGVFTYPVLMAADILAFRSTDIPVGQDQKQHVEIARDIALRFNHLYGEVLAVPNPIIREDVEVIPGLDGRKMSKSYDNTIPLFDTPKAIKKRVMSIVTDSTPLEDPKNPETCNVFALYRRLATPEQIDALAAQYRAGNFGWGDAKKALLAVMQERFSTANERYNALMADTAQIDAVFAHGAVRARERAGAVLADVKRAVGL